MSRVTTSEGMHKQSKEAFVTEESSICFEQCIYHSIAFTHVYVHEEKSLPAESSSLKKEKGNGSSNPSRIYSQYPKNLTSSVCRYA